MPSCLRHLHHVRHETCISRFQIMDGKCRHCWKLRVNTELISCHFNHTVTNLLELSCDQSNNAHGYITGCHDPLKNSRLKSCGLLLCEQKICHDACNNSRHATSKSQVKLCDETNYSFSCSPWPCHLRLLDCWDRDVEFHCWYGCSSCVGVGTV
jgi:hypothetical protein